MPPDNFVNTSDYCLPFCVLFWRRIILPRIYNTILLFYRGPWVEPGPHPEPRQKPAGGRHRIARACGALSCGRRPRCGGWSFPLSKLFLQVVNARKSTAGVKNWRGRRFLSTPASSCGMNICSQGTGARWRSQKREMRLQGAVRLRRADTWDNRIWG